MFSLSMPVREEITINVPRERVFQVLSDFQSWASWSPWLHQEPECEVTIEGQPAQPEHRQSWNGQWIGQGNMELTRREGESRLEYDLAFLKPWKSESKVRFILEEAGAHTRVTWEMDGSLPFFLFFLKKMMVALISNDYRRGLNMLKELLETGEVPTRTQVEGVDDKSGFHYLGTKRTCSLDDIGTCMEQDFGALGQLIENQKLPKPDHMLSLYHDYDMVNGKCTYTSAAAYKTKPQTDTEQLVDGSLPAHRALKVKHTGPYRFLGNAWSAAMSYQRAKHKANKSVVNYEMYVNMPGQVPESELETEIFVPVK